MKIILHGATNGSNFGDYLFADIFWNKLLDYNRAGRNIFFEFPKYGIGDYFREGLGYTKKQTIGDVLNADMLIYFSGGYFGERTTALKESIRRFIRYLPIGMLFVLRNKTILIIGVGGGPVTNRFLRMAFCNILNHATVVTVRDEETANYFKNYGVKRELCVTSDTAQIITSDLLPALDDSIKEIIKKNFLGKKIIFLHALPKDNIDKEISVKVIPALNNFLENHRNYGVIIGYDGVYTKSIEELNTRTQLTCETIYCYNYQEPWQLCSLLNEVDMIITSKLHVGIIGATFSKSVLAFPIHSEKTKRYYKQIDEPERCIALKDVSPAMVESKLESLHDKKIILSKEIIKAANRNLDVLGENIQILKGSKCKKKGC